MTRQFSTTTNVDGLILRHRLGIKVLADFQRARQCAWSPWQAASNHWADFMSTWMFLDHKETERLIKYFDEDNLLEGIREWMPTDVLGALPMGLEGLDLRKCGHRPCCKKPKLAVYYNSLYS